MLARHLKQSNYLAEYGREVEYTEGAITVIIIIINLNS